MSRYDDSEFRTQSHEMWAEGSTYGQPNKREIELYVKAKGYEPSKIEFSFDDMFGFWRWYCDIEPLKTIDNQIKFIKNMKKQDLTITVSGELASGKSILTYLLKEFLRDKGFEVNLEPNLEFQTELDFDKNIAENINKNIKALKETRKITFKVVQLPK